MKWSSFSRDRKWLIVPPVLLGLVVVALLVLSRAGPERAPEREEARALRVISASSVDVVPRALGYGLAQPGRVWKAVAEVGGRVVEIHPELGSGAMIQQGETLLRIDPTEYELARARLEADIAQVDAQLAELTVKQANDETLLKLEGASLQLAERELQRAEALHQRDAISASAIDQQRRAALTQRQSVQRLRNSLNVLPPQRKALEATLAVKRAGLAQAELDLAKTVIAAPFACRLGEVRIQPGQFVAVGQALFEAHGTELTEIETQIPLDQLRSLVHPDQRIALPVSMDADTVQRLFGFRVIVRYRSGDFTAEWEGRVVRIREQLDPRTRTVGLVVAVDKPYEQAIPGTRPPLVQGMYCEAELQGAVREAQIIIPRAALHDGHVYIVGSDNRLRRRKVEVAFTQSGFHGLREGLREGERLVVSDPTPAIEGRLIEPIPDGTLQQRLIADATAQTSLR